MFLLPVANELGLIELELSPALAAVLPHPLFLFLSLLSHHHLLLLLRFLLRFLLI